MTIWAKEDPLDGSDVLRVITDRVTFSNLGIAIPITNFSPKIPGEYIVFIYGQCFIIDAAAGQLTISLQFTDETGFSNTDIGTLSLNSPNFLSSIFLIRSINGIVSFSTTVFGSFGAAKYTLRMICQKL